MTAGYIKMFTGIAAEVTELGNVWLNKKFAGTHNINIDTARSGSDLVLLLTDDDDPSMLAEEVYGDLGLVVERIKEIDQLADEEDSDLA